MVKKDHVAGLGVLTGVRVQRNGLKIFMNNFYFLFSLMSKITPFIRCESNASELADFYCSVFPESKIIDQNPITTTVEIFGRTL
jgi:hypothetical protein